VTTLYALRLQLKLEAVAADLLSRVRRPLKQSLRVIRQAGPNQIEITLTPISAAGTTCPGRFLSDVEEAIWKALESSPLIGKQIAAAAGLPYTGQFRTILVNLAARGVIVKVPGGGYRRAL